MILEVTAVPFNVNHLGGGESYPWRIFNGLSKVEDVTFCSSLMKGEDLKIDKFCKVPSYFFDVAPFLNIHNPIPNVAGLKVIKKMVRNDEVEFIHIHNLRTLSSTLWLFLSKLNKNEQKYKVILTDHSSKVFPFPKLTAKFVDYYAPVSNFSSKLLNRYASRPTFVVPPIVPSDMFIERNYENRDLDIVVYGRIAPWKRQDKAIEIANLLVKDGIRDLKMIIAGSVQNHYYLADLKSIVRRKNLEKNIRFVIDAPHEYVKNLMSRANMMFQLSWNIDMYNRKYKVVELSSAAILEANAAGVPVIASKMEVFSELVSNGINGVLVDPTDSENNFEIVSSLLKSGHDLSRMGLEAKRKCMERHSENSVIKNLLENLDKIRKGII